MKTGGFQIEKFMMINCGNSTSSLNIIIATRFSNWVIIGVCKTGFLKRIVNHNAERHAGLKQTNETLLK